MDKLELKGIAEGIAMISSGKIPITKIIGGTSEIANIEFDPDYHAVITYIDGNKITITKVDMDADGRITTVYMSMDGSDEVRYVDCTYEGDSLKLVGDVVIDDIEELGIETTVTTQNKTVTPGTEEQTVTVDGDYDALGTVTIKAVTLQAKMVKPAAESQMILPDEGYLGLSAVEVSGVEGGNISALASFAFAEDYTATVTDVEEKIKEIVPTLDSNGTIQMVTVNGKEVSVVYREDGTLERVGDVEVSGIGLLSMFAEASAGNGGGTEMMEQTVLWEGIANQEGSSITLTESIRNYDAIVAFACISLASGQKEQFSSIVIPSASYDYKSTVVNEENWSFVINLSKISDNRRVVFNITSNNTITIGAAEDTAALASVVGLKFISRINYSTSEQCIGTWIDRKPLYQKTFNIGSLPNKTADCYYTPELDNPEIVMIAEAQAINSQGVSYSMPYVDNNTLGYGLSIYWTGTQIRLLCTQGDRSDYTGYVTLRYTKTTD